MNLLSANQIEYRVGEHTLLQELSLQLPAGELLGLIGPNGAGKSTLLRTLCGLLAPTAGSVSLKQQPLEQIGPKERARQIAYLGQEQVVHWPLQVERLIALGRLPHLGTWQTPTPHDQKVIEKIMDAADLLALRNRSFDTLSGGERMRVLLSRALAVEPAVLLADEPVAALDPSHQLDVMALLKEHCRAGNAAIVVLHDLSLASHYCDRLQLLHQGRCVTEGTPQEVLTPEHLAQVYQIRSRQALPSAGIIPPPWEKNS